MTGHTKAAQTHQQALEELRRHAGTQFDPEVVEIFCAIYADAVPPDGLEEVYRLRERARGGLDHVEAIPHEHPLAVTPPQRRTARTREASG